MTDRGPNGHEAGSHAPFDPTHWREDLMQRLVILRLQVKGPELVYFYYAGGQTPGIDRPVGILRQPFN